LSPRLEDSSTQTTVARIARQAREDAEVAQLNRTLAVLLDLGASYRHAHWNVRGPGFPALSALFQTFAQEVVDATDTVAERAVTLGGKAEGTLQATVARSVLRAMAVDTVTADELVPALRQRAGQVADLLRAEVARRSRDQVTRQVHLNALHAIERQLSLLSGRLLSAADPMT
jgi:starvation-inducible DNA-binding protein